jgi:hypothetical protein
LANNGFILSLHELTPTLAGDVNRLSLVFARYLRLLKQGVIPNEDSAALSTVSKDFLVI